MTDLDQLALLTSCGYCRAPAETWCKTGTGGRARWLHGDRMRVALEAYAAGYQDAERDHARERGDTEGPPLEELGDVWATDVDGWAWWCKPCRFGTYEPTREHAEHKLRGHSLAVHPERHRRRQDGR